MDLVNASDLTCIVSKAVKSLQDLETFTKTQKGISEDEYHASSIKNIIEALEEMNRDRMKLHELLEKETILASSLRFKLQIMPTQIKSEVQNAVVSARDLNESDIQQLKANINNINSNIKELEERYQKLLSENLRLAPEQSEAQSEHDTVINLLNEKMTDKASKQITLNETRDTLRETSKMIKELGESNEQLKEDIALEKEETIDEKERLKKAVEETRAKVKEQKEKNEEQKIQIAKLQEEMVESEGILEAKRKIIRGIETSKGKLEAQTVQLSRQLQKAIKSNSILTQEGMRVMKSHQETLTNLEKTKDDLEHEYETFIGEGERRTYTAEFQKVTLDEDHDVLFTECKKVKEKVKDNEQRIRRSRDQLKSKTDECSRLKNENYELEDEIKQLKESHQAMADAYTHRIDELKSGLKKERSEKASIQIKRENLAKDTSDFKNEYSTFMISLSNIIQSAKNEHSALTEKGNELQKNLRDDEQELLEKKDALKEAKESYAETQKALQKELETLQESIEQLEKDIAENQKTFAERQPSYELLEQQFDEKSKEYAELKQSIIGRFEEQKASLELSIQRTNKEIERTKEPRKRLQEEINTTRVESLRVMAEQNAEIKNIEKENLICCRKLQRVLKENARFEEAIQQAQEEIKFLEVQRESKQVIQGKVEEKLSQFKDEIMASREEDFNLDQMYAKRDQKILEDIQKLQGETKDREMKVDDIHKKLEHELSLFASFIEGVANLRPRDGTVES